MRLRSSFRVAAAEWRTWEQEKRVHMGNSRVVYGGLLSKEEERIVGYSSLVEVKIKRTSHMMRHKVSVVNASSWKGE